MIRLLQRRLIIPRGDTGSFTVPLLSQGNTDNIAVFTIFDELTRTRLFQKIIQCEGDAMNVVFTHNDTVNLKPGKYLWDIKFYQNPQFVDEELVNGDEVDSYYAGFSLPVCEIRETADNYLVSPDAPTAMLTPEQLDIITGAINSLNEAIEKTQSNVEHYPIVRNEVWYTWDAETQDYVSTGVRANGIVGPAGTGISSVVLNDDYTLTLNLTDGTSFTSTSIRGEVGNGINDIVLNSNYTLTIRYTDGEVYTTPSIRGAVGATPQFSIGTVQDGAVAAATITGTAKNPVLNLTLPNAHVPTRVSQLENDADYLTTESDPTVPAWAKAAQKPTYTAEEVGAPTVAEMNTAIGEAISHINSFDMAIVQALPTQNISTHTIYLVPKTGETNDVYDEYVYINNDWEMIGNTQIDLSNYATKDELPDVPVQDVKINGTSILNNGIANVPIATINNLGVVKVSANDTTSNGIIINPSNALQLSPATEAEIKAASNIRRAIVPSSQSASVFYGLAKAAGHDEKNSTLSLGQYTDEAKTAIQTMLDVPAKSDIPDVPVQDVQVNGASVLEDGIANIPIAKVNVTGTVRADSYYGVYTNNNGTLMINPSDSGQVKAGANTYRPIVPYYQHLSVFYGLAKAAGDATQPSASNVVGNYTDEAKTAIQTMLDVPAKSDIPNVPVQDVQVNSTSILNNNIANIPYGTTDVFGVVKALPNYGVYADRGTLSVAKAENSQVKEGTHRYKPLVPYTQHLATFYGLATAAGDTTQSQSNNEVGNYTDTAKEKIQSMLGISEMLAPENPNLVATQAYAIGDIFTANGKLYKATAVIAADAAIIPAVEGEEVAGANCVETSIGEGFPHDVQIAGTSIIQNGVANIPMATGDTLGAIKVYSSVSYGINKTNDGIIRIAKADSNDIVAGTHGYKPITPNLQHESTFYGLAKAAGDTTQSQSNNAVGTYTDDAKSAIKNMIGINVEDVQINNSSIINNGVATIPIATTGVFGVTKANLGAGIGVDSVTSTLYVNRASIADIKTGAHTYKPIVPSYQHISVFYGLAMAAGDTTQSASSNTVGTYTDNAKASIKSMLGIIDGSTGTVDVSGAAPTITAVENTRYVCGEVTSLDFTPAASGVCIVRFTSGSTPTLLTLPSTVKFPEWFDSTALETDTIYEMCITDGVYGAVMSWAL